VDLLKGNPKFPAYREFGRADGYFTEIKSSRGGAVRQFPSAADGTSKPFRDQGLDVAVDSNNAVAVVGTFAGTADFDPSAAAHFPDRRQVHRWLSVARYKNNGAYINAGRFSPGEVYGGITNVAFDSGNNLVVTGYFEGNEFRRQSRPPARQILAATPVDTGNDPQIPRHVCRKSSIRSCKCSGCSNWPARGFEFVDQMKIDSSDNIILGGSFYSSKDFNTRFGTGGPTLASGLNQDKFDKDLNDGDRFFSYDAFLWKLNSSGTTQWGRPDRRRPPTIFGGRRGRGIRRLDSSSTGKIQRLRQTSQPQAD